MGLNLEARASIAHHFTSPSKVKIQAVIDFNTTKGLLRSKQEVFDYFKVEHIRGYAMLNDDTNRRRHNTGLPDPHGRPSKLSKINVGRVDEILQTWGLKARVFTWTQLGTAAEVPEFGGELFRKL